ncbi:leucine Rich repeat-containing domain protein, partial [Ostertagia ostertagi]
MAHPKEFIQDLSHNHIASLDRTRVKSVLENELHFLPSGAFSLLTRLEYLRLSGNSIESFHKTAMTGLDNLNELDLSSNSLAVCLEDNAMLYNTSMPFLKSLKFRNNQLRVIPSRAFERFPALEHLAHALEHLDLSDNPITTDTSGSIQPTSTSGIIFGHFGTAVRLSLGMVLVMCARLLKNGSGPNERTINGQELASAELLLLDVSTSDRAEYQCVVRNRFAAEHSIRSVLKIFQVPIFLNEPDDMSLLVGQNAKIMCAAT